MHIAEDTVDDLLRETIGHVLDKGGSICPRRGKAREVFGILLELRNPRARLSLTENRGMLFSALGEFLWYLAGDQTLDFIQYYVPKYGEDSEDGKTIFGAYGPRLVAMHGNRDQLATVVDVLRRRPASRRAVIQLIDADDVAEEHKEIPCTCTLQFAVRGGCLHMLTSMRSNDVFLGLPHDIFAFTMLQEVLARQLDTELGIYKHSVGSLHLYDDNVLQAQAFLQEGWQEAMILPPMPVGDPSASIKQVLGAESTLRSGTAIDESTLGLDSYWIDIVRLLEVYAHCKHGRTSQIPAVRERMVSKVYDVYIEKKMRLLCK